MIPGSFTYLTPKSLPEALGLMEQYGEDAKVLAGGQSLIPMMRFRLAEPKYLIDINKIAGLAELTERGGQLVIGALAREVALSQSALIAERYPLLADTVRVVADPLVRNLATVGGNLAHADPANDHPAAMLALRATVIATGPNGERVIPIDDFFVDIFTTALEPGELLTEIRVPAPAARTGGAYVKFERKFGDYAIAATAAQVTLAADGTVQQVGIGLTNVASVPLRAARSEARLLGQAPTEAAIQAAAALASEDCDPTSDLRGTAEYKRAMVRTMTSRALRLAVERATSAS